MFCKPEIADAIRRVINGDRDAYDAVYNRVDPPLRRILRKQYRFFGDDFADEVAIRTHLSAIDNLDKYDPERSSFLTWLVWQAKNVARKVISERFPPREVRLDESAHEPWASTSTGPAEEHEAARRLRVVREELECLAGDGRAAIELHDIQGLS